MSMANAAYQQYQQQPMDPQQQQAFYQQQQQQQQQQQMPMHPQQQVPQQGYVQQLMPGQQQPQQQQQVMPQQQMGHPQQMAPGPPQGPPPPQHGVPVDHQEGQAPAAPGGTEEYGNNPIPMSQAQLAALLENISTLDTQGIILEPGVMIGETGQVLNLSVIRTKVNSPSYTLPEMLVDLNSICEPFLNQGPDHANYATSFLEQANQAIVDAVRDAQFAASGGQQGMDPNHPGAYGMPGQMGQVAPGGYMMAGEHGGYVEGQQGHMGMQVMGQEQGQGASWISEVVGEDGQTYMNGRMPPGGMPGYPGGMPMGTPDSSKKKKRPGEGLMSPDKDKRPHLSAPRPRLEGRRCQVCAVIKKAGCGTENAHFRCLKKKKPEIAIELEKRVGELKDVGEEERVTVWNPKEGRKLSGQAAPMLKNLAGWLASHPGWEAHPRVSTGTPPSSGPKTKLEGDNASPQVGISPQPQLPQVPQQSPMMAPQQLAPQFQQAPGAPMMSQQGPPMQQMQQPGPGQGQGQGQGQVVMPQGGMPGDGSPYQQQQQQPQPPMPQQVQVQQVQQHRQGQGQGQGPAQGQGQGQGQVPQQMMGPPGQQGQMQGGQMAPQQMMQPMGPGGVGVPMGQGQPQQMQPMQQQGVMLPEQHVGSYTTTWEQQNVVPAPIS